MGYKSTTNFLLSLIRLSCRNRKPSMSTFVSIFAIRKFAHRSCLDLPTKARWQRIPIKGRHPIPFVHQHSSLWRRQNFFASWVGTKWNQRWSLKYCHWSTSKSKGSWSITNQNWIRWRYHSRQVFRRHPNVGWRSPRFKTAYHVLFRWVLYFINFSKYFLLTSSQSTSSNHAVFVLVYFPYYSYHVLYGKKAKCVIKIVPQEQKCNTMQIDDKCIKKR